MRFHIEIVYQMGPNTHCVHLLGLGILTHFEQKIENESNFII